MTNLTNNEEHNSKIKYYGALIRDQIKRMKDISQSDMPDDQKVLHAQEAKTLIDHYKSKMRDHFQ